jgi:hypothetical protein
MNAVGTRRRTIERVVWISTVIDVLAYVCKFLPVWRASVTAETAIIVMDEVGLLISVLILIAAPFVVRGWKIPVFAIGMLVLGYLWFSSVAWWVMVK